ncbi:STM4504/CBY_0614 family protein [Stieleria varia]|uniref:Abortive infection protein-like C-terminal domain-containing protein n=1 Tax=Stieleria varia TaxID=2528005 RepID=A0A5C5ZI65_9BACT|nr:hypothetical protein [Stieleria varia]TWT87054.1 hypothetical protein Pla52n_70270 [Stieleria varia]
MAVFDLFSKRQKRLRGDVPEVYVYDDVPSPLRVQLVQILQDGIGRDEQFQDVPLQLYAHIHKTLCREYGVFSLTKEHRSSDWESVANYLLQTDDVEHIIDIVELCLRAVDTVIRERNWQYIGCSSSPDATIAEANSRFKEHGVGFEYVSGEVIRIDSQLIHDDVVKPALKLLSDPKYKGANDEFLKAHEHYRHGRHKECLAECLKAFESTMKTICDLKGWQYQPRDTAKTLIDTCMTNGLFPTFMQSHIGNLRAILESGVPTVRNKLGGHGQGATVTTVSESTARFALHSTAANILLFVESV